MVTVEKKIKNKVGNEQKRERLNDKIYNDRNFRKPTRQQFLEKYCTKGNRFSVGHR